jgi:hypothetical protein
MSQMQHDAVGETDDATPVGKPRTTTVLGLLALTSLTFSYLGSYAVSGALVSAEVIRAWPPGADPRPKWLAIGFCSLLASFVLLGVVARCLSRRQLRRIDAMDQEDAAA